MKAEYIDHMPGFNPTLHDIRMMDGEKRFNLGSFKPDGKVIKEGVSEVFERLDKEQMAKAERRTIELNGNKSKHDVSENFSSLEYQKWPKQQGYAQARL